MAGRGGVGTTLYGMYSSSADLRTCSDAEVTVKVNQEGLFGLINEYSPVLHVEPPERCATY